MKSVELFAGAGGLAIGMAKAGFHHAAVVEWNSDACETFRENKRHHTHHVQGRRLHEGDVRELRPKAFIFENVKGLKRDTFATYFEYIRLQLTYPGLQRREGESWRDHCRHLEKHHTARQASSDYNVVSELLNAANYGVPQR